MAMHPAIVENHLDCVQFWEDGRLILGSSNLRGPLWNGSIWCFQKAGDAPHIEKCITGTETESGITDILCLSGNRVIIGQDCGSVELHRLESNPGIFGCMNYAAEHDDIVSSLSINPNQPHIIVSGSYDRCVKVWDVEAWCSISTFRPAHADIVWQVSFSACEPQVFMSCSQDGKMLLWDLRLPKPATVVNKNPLVSIPTAIAWQPQKSTVFAAGDDSGNIILKDLRGIGSILQKQVYKRGIYRLAFCPQNPLWVASCADDSVVNVLETGNDSFSHLYENDSHSDFVRGLAWAPDSTLVSCGWDKQVLTHSILPGDKPSANQNGRASTGEELNETE